VADVFPKEIDGVEDAAEDAVFKEKLLAPKGEVG
jgi:hypothetical protein